MTCERDTKQSAKNNDMKHGQEQCINGPFACEKHETFVDRTLRNHLPLLGRATTGSRRRCSSWGWLALASGIIPELKNPLQVVDEFMPGERLRLGKLAISRENCASPPYQPYEHNKNPGFAGLAYGVPLRLRSSLVHAIRSPTFGLHTAPPFNEPLPEVRRVVECEVVVTMRRLEPPLDLDWPLIRRQACCLILQQYE